MKEGGREGGREGGKEVKTLCSDVCSCQKIKRLTKQSTSMKADVEKAKT